MGLFDQFPYTNIHELNLDWVMSQLKRYGIVIDGLPDYINNAIKNMLDDLNLTDIVIDAIAQYGAAINVKAPGHDLTPAKGDGVSDDTQALQAIINYGAQNNLPLLFYNGTFMASSLNISSGVFLGTDAQIMKIGNTSDPLIYCTGEFKADGLRINGNLTGQSDPEATVQLFGASDVEFMDCEIDGGTSCITGDVSEALKLTNCTFKQYTEYAVHSEGTGFIQSNGCRVDSVASGGALRFMRIDTSNGIVADFISTASVQTGFELTGDFNYISARIPNTENHVNDGGQNNSYFFFGNDEKKVLNGNSMETVGGTKTESYENRKETVTGDVTENYGDHDETATHFHVTAEQDVNLSGQDIVLNTVNPLTYKTPIKLDSEYNYVPAKDYDGNEYKLLVYSGARKEKDYINVDDYGAVGDGITNDYAAVSAAVNEGNSTGKTVKFSKNKQYLIDGDTIKVLTDIDFDGCILVMPNKEGDLFGDIEEYSTTSYSTSDITTNGTTNDELKGKTFGIRTLLNMGPRDGNASDTYFQTIVACDEDGNFKDGPLPEQLIYGSRFSAQYIHDTYTRPITLKNVKIKYQESDTMLCGFWRGSQNFITIKNVEILSPNVTHSGNSPYLIFLRYAAFCRIENIVGYGPSLMTDVSSYLLRIEHCTEIIVKNLNVRGGWSNIGSAWIKNIKVTDSLLNRIDCHYGMVGEFIVDNCVTDASQGGINFGPSYGHFIVSNTKLMSKDVSCCHYRKDFGMPMEGSIVFKNCIFETTSSQSIRCALGTTEPITAIDNLDDFSMHNFLVVFDDCSFINMTGLCNMRMDTELSSYFNMIVTNIMTTEPIRFAFGEGFSTLEVTNCKLAMGYQQILDNSFLYMLINNCQNLSFWFDSPYAYALISNSSLRPASDNHLRFAVVNNCIILTDNGPSLTGKYKLSNNIIAGASTTHESEWNTDSQ